MCVIEANWQGETGTLDEHFTYSDGTTQRRVWTITKLGENRYKGTADDVVGEAVGEAAGNALRWRYVLALPVDGKVYHVDFDDWMYLVDERGHAQPLGDEQVGLPARRGHALLHAARIVNAPIRDWRDKRVWIVGASSGIGAALAEALLEQGAEVAMSARSADKLDRIAGRWERAWPLPLDATSEQQLAAAWQQIVARWGGVDLVVCMAGTYAPLRAWELAPEVIAVDRRDQPHERDADCGHGPAPVPGAGHGRPRPRRQCGGISRAAEGGGVRADQGGPDQLRGSPASGSGAEGDIGVPDQPGFRRHAAHGEE